MGSYELSIQLRLAVLEEHLNNFLEIGVQFIERGCLGMGTRKSRHVPHIQTCCRIELYNSRESPGHISFSLRLQKLTTANACNNTSNGHQFLIGETVASRVSHDPQRNGSRFVLGNLSGKGDLWDFPIEMRTQAIVNGGENASLGLLRPIVEDALFLKQDRIDTGRGEYLLTKEANE